MSLAVEQRRTEVHSGSLWRGGGEVKIH
jgi:hypothetical protein